MLEDINPEYYYLDNKNKAEGLLMFAEKQKVNLMIVVHRKRGLVEQLFHKSITQKLAFKTSVPLFILHKN
jgi:nucleotide-binding universal stress UspA family protein